MRCCARAVATRSRLQPRAELSADSVAPASDRRFMTISAWRQQLQSGEVSSRELVDQHLKRLEAAESSLNVYIEVTGDRARADATRIDEARASGEALGPLAGLPLAIKDSLCTQGVRTTCSSRMLETFVPPTKRRSPNGSGRRVASWWAKPTWMSSPWAARPNVSVRPHPEPLEYGSRSWRQLRWQRCGRWPPVAASHPLAQIPVARFVSRPRSAGLWASNPLMDE